jgi:hypothetical protein
MEKRMNLCQFEASERNASVPSRDRTDMIASELADISLTVDYGRRYERRGYLYVERVAISDQRTGRGGKV